MMHPEMMLVFIKYINTVEAEVDKKGAFLEETIDSILFGEYI